MRPIRSLTLAAMVALSLAACGSETVDPAKQQDAVAKVAAPQGSSWSQTITQTDDGGFVMGNPDAPITLVEYGSLTCSHCADFSTSSTDELSKNFVDTGQVAFEFRNYLLNPQVDALAATIITCAGKDRYYPLTENLFANQGELYGHLQAMGTPPEIGNLPDNQKFVVMAKAMGLDKFFGARGVSEDEITQCLSDPAKVQAVADRSQKGGEQYNITGTPTFVLNGSVVDEGNTWPLIRERLRTAGAR
ncbi:MAG: thioredoxin domain-containing protein [Sphingomonadales bacterium]|nr:thioredoxin domain-containing protein [Sphingomonadales bacterium]